MPFRRSNSASMLAAVFGAGEIDDLLPEPRLAIAGEAVVILVLFVDKATSDHNLPAGELCKSDLRGDCRSSTAGKPTNNAAHFSPFAALAGLAWYSQVSRNGLRLMAQVSK